MYWHFHTEDEEVEIHVKNTCDLAPFTKYDCDFGYFIESSVKKLNVGLSACEVVNAAVFSLRLLKPNRSILT